MIKTTKDAILAFKMIYDTGGVDGATALFKGLLGKGNDERTAKLVLFLMHVLFKIETCTQDCFEKIEERRVINCQCNDEPMVIPLEGDFTVEHA